VKQETAEQLELFRKQRAAAEQAHIEGTHDGTPGASTDGSSWATKKKKRRREKDGEPSGDVKLRKLSTADNDKSVLRSSDANSPAKSESPHQARDNNVEAVPSKVQLNQKSAGLGLAAYSSDEDD
jgi:hypothetical protein